MRSARIGWNDGDVMGLRIVLMACAAATALAGAALAEVTPRQGQHDPRVRVASYVDGQVYRVNTSLTHVTTIEFGEGETIRSIIAGDTEGFNFDGVPGGRAFAIKPMMRGVSTNITVYTNQRSYYFTVHETSAATHYVVRFSYPQARPAPAAIASAAPNTLYGASGQSEITPVAVWDDGRFTYFRFAPNAPMPAIFRYGTGGERSVNTATHEEGVIRVSGVSRQWVLRLGDQVICIEAREPAA